MIEHLIKDVGGERVWPSEGLATAALADQHGRGYWLDGINGGNAAGGEVSVRRHFRLPGGLDCIIDHIPGHMGRTELVGLALPPGPGR